MTWPLNGSEAEVTFVKFSYKPHCFSFGNHVILMLTSFHLHMKRIEVSIKTTLFSLLLKLTIGGKLFTLPQNFAKTIKLTIKKLLLFSWAALSFSFVEASFKCHFKPIITKKEIRRHSFGTI